VRKILVTAFVLIAPMSALHAQSMPVSQFLGKAEALEKKGMRALFSSDIGVLKAEVMNSGKQLRAEQEAALKAGRKPATCLPKKAQMNSNELLAYLRAIPPAQRNMPIKAAFAGLMRKKYPCPA